jgi:PAS domain S-box-containing protein
MLIRTRLILVAVLPAVIVLLIGSLLWASWIKIDEARQGAELAAKVRVSNFELNILTQEYLLYGGKRVESQLWIQHQSIDGLLAQMKYDGAEERELVEALRQDHQELGNLYALLLKGGSPLPNQIVGALLVKTQDIRAKSEQFANIQQRQIVEYQRRADKIIMVVLVLLAGVSAMLLSLLVRRINRGIDQLNTGVRQLTEGNLDQKIELNSDDELGALAHAINDMSRKLLDSYTSIDKLNDVISERRQAEAELRSSEERFRIAAETTNDVIYEWDLKQSVLWSGRIDEMLGYAPGEFPRTLNGWASALHPEDKECTMAQISAHLEGRAPYAAEYRVRRKDGVYRWWSARGAITKTPDGTPVRWIGSVTDITERKQSEHKMHEMLKAANQSRQVMLGVVEDQKRAEAALNQLNDELEEKVAGRTAALEQARNDAEQASRAKSAFLASMSHEIRTPMNGVIGMLDVLQQSSLNSSQIDMANIIHDSAFSLLGIIDDILDFSKIEAGKLQIEIMPMSVADVVEGTCETLARMASKKEVELTLFTDPAIPAAVMGDAGRLRQILVNLTNNAIKFSGRQPSGRVSVCTLLAKSTPEQVTLEFRVTDNGIGMDYATQAKLFTPFTQADTSTTRIYGGTGLGLVIARQLANIMGGEIAVQSEPGKGSVFSVRLPFALPLDVGRVSTRHDDGIGLKPDLQNLPCLVVGGMESLADDHAAYLAHAGALIERASDLALADAWIAGRPPGLCLVVIDTAGSQQQLNELRTAARSRPGLDVRFVAIGRGQQREPRLQDADLVLVDGNVLTREVLLKAVAMVSGQFKEPDLDDQDIKATYMPLSREEARQNGTLILVAEDNEINQKVILQQLTLFGFTADIANNGREALEMWQNNHYGILLSDIHMPEMDGYELTAAIRAAENVAKETGKPRIPIIALTANALKGEAEHCHAVGMDDYLSKPVQLLNLKAMLKKWLPVAFLPRSETAPPELPVDEGQTITERLADTLEKKTPQLFTKERMQEFLIQQEELKIQNDNLQQAHCALEESRDRYMNLYEFAQVAYLTLSENGMISEVNLAGATLLGLECTKLLQRRFDRIVAPEDRDRWQRQFISAMKYTGAAINLLLQRGDGSRFNAHINCLHMVSDQAKSVLRLAIVDLTEHNPASPVPVDVNVLKALIGGDDEAMIRDFLNDFRLSAAKIAVELRAACESGQATTAGAHAHKLKSSARSVGALALGELCFEMEQAGKAGDNEALAVLLPKFEQELAGVEGYLEGY